MIKLNSKKYIFQFTIALFILTGAGLLFPSLVSAGTITFNDQYKDIYRGYFYDDSEGTYSARPIDGKNMDYFDDDAVTGDAIIFAVNRAEAGKYNEIKFNVSTPLVADNITVVWEYAKRGTGSYDTTWHSLSSVTDNTNAFQNAGVNSVTFTCPEDWENYHNPGGKCLWYAWYIRCRIVSATNLTEGGKQSSDSVKVKPVTIWVSGFTEGSPCTLQDIYDEDVANGWGVVTKNENTYTFNCGLSTDQSTGYFETKQEVIQFLKNWDCWFYGKIKSGEVETGDKCMHGSEFVFNIYNGDLGGILGYDNAEIYNTHYRHIQMSGSSVYHGHWGGGLGERPSQKLYDIYGEGFRMFTFREDTNVIIGAKGYGTAIQQPGAILKDITCYGTDASVKPNYTNTGDYVHQSDFSGATSYAVLTWLNLTDNFVMYFVDCNWGDFAEDHLARWYRPGINDSIYAVNSFLLKVIDKDNDAISGATVTLKDKNDSEVFSYTTSPEGYIGQDYGSVSSATAETLTDNSKSWTSNQWWFKEVYITAGKGIGQRRIIKKGNTATELQVAPDWDTTPDTTSKYIIIPYVNVKKIEPITPNYPGFIYSTVDDLNPFTVTISHQDYPPREFEFTLDKKINWTIALKDKPTSAGSVKVWGTEYADDEAGTIYAQVFYGDGSPCNTLASSSITATVYKSGGTKIIDGAQMTYVEGSNGIYKYDFPGGTFTDEGVYIIDVMASSTDPNITAYNSNEIHISQTANKVADIKESLIGFTGAADSGSATTLVDDALIQTDDFWNGMTLVITAGTNAGEIRQIEDFNAASDTITVKTAFTSAIDNTSQYLIRREMNWAERIWSWNNRSLTAFGNLAADIWNTTYSGARKLTSRQIADEANEHIAQEENVASNVWNALTSGLTTNESIGKLLATNIDDKISNIAGNVWNYTGGITNALIQNLGDAIWNSYTGTRKLTSRQIGTDEYIAGVSSPSPVSQVADQPTQENVEYNVELVRKATFDFAGFADSGSTTALVDSELTQPDDHWNNYELWMMSGNNIGLKRAICDFDRTSHTITLCGDALSQPIEANDQYVISHERKLVHSIWNWTDRQLTSAGNIASAVWGWTESPRKLTSRWTDEATPVDLAQVADISDLATSAELATAKTNIIAEINNNETLINNLNNISAQEVWEYGTRDLTGSVSLSDPTQIWDIATSALTETGSIGKQITDNLDAQISTRSTLTAADVWSESTRTLTDYAASSIALAVWNNAQRTLTSYGNDITAADVWNVLTSTLTTENSIGKQLSDNVDATISSRAPSATALSSITWTDEKAEYLDATISSRASQTSINALNNISVADVWSYANRSITDPDAIWEYALTQIGDTGSIGLLLKNNIDAAVSSRSSHTAADVWNVVTRTLTSNDNFNDPTSAQIAADVWAEANRTLTDYGNDITAAEVWEVMSNTLTTNGTIGKQLAENVDAKISSRSTQTSVNALQTDINYIRSKTDSIYTDTQYISGKIDEILTKWGSYSAADIMDDLDTVKSRIGASTDSSADETLFGRTKFIQEKWGVQTAQTIYDTASSALALADDVQTELGYNGTSTTAYADLQLIKGWTDELEEYVGTPSDNSSAGTLFGKIKDVREKLDQLNTLETKLDTVDSIVNALRSSQQLNYTVELSDVGEIETTKSYKAKLSIWDYENNPVNATSTPTIVLYDAERTEMISGQMSLLSTGIYEYTYVVPSDAVCGLWESIVSIDLGGDTPLTLNDYWEVEGSPAQVIINSMSDLTVPSISANVTISNEGNSGYEYQYEWCVVTSQDNQCGGGDDIDYASAAKYLGVGEDYTANLSATVPNTGDYWFKVVVYYGTEASGASRTFSAVEEEEATPTPPGGGAAVPIASLANIYNKLLEIQNELGYHNTHRTAYKDLSNTKYSLDILPSQISDPLYAILTGVSFDIQAVRGDQGYNLDDLYSVSQADSRSLKYIVNKTAELKAIIDVNKSLISAVVNQPIIQTWWEQGSIILKIMIMNPPSAVSRIVTVKEYLPKEIRSEHIIEIEQGLQLEYDSGIDTYFVTGKIELDPGERKIFAIKAEDVFKISENELKSLKEQSDTLMAPLRGTSYFAQAAILKSEIDANINGILRQQAGQPTNIEKKILIFRDNQKDLQKIKENIESLKKIVSEVSGKSGVFGSLFGISSTMTWAIIIIVIVGVGVLMILLWAILMRSRALEYHISGGRHLKAPPIVNVKKQAKKIKGGLITYFLPPFGKPLVDLKQMIKMIKILIILGILIALALLVFYFFEPKNNTGLRDKIQKETTLSKNELNSKVEATNLHPNKKIALEAKKPLPKKQTEESNKKITRNQNKLKIIETGIGWLYVRSGHSANDKILGKVNVGEEFNYTDKQDNWYKIILGDRTNSPDGTGWVSGEYVEIIPNF